MKFSVDEGIGVYDKEKDVLQNGDSLPDQEEIPYADRASGRSYRRNDPVRPDDDLFRCSQADGSTDA